MNDEKKPRKLWPWIVAILLLFLVFSNIPKPSGSHPEKATYSDAIALVQAKPKSIRSVLFDPASRTVVIELKTYQTKSSRWGRWGGESIVYDKVVVHYPSDQAQIEFQHLLKKQHVKFDVKGVPKQSFFGSLLRVLLPIIIIFAILMFVMRRMQGGTSGGGGGGSGNVMSWGKSRAKRAASDAPKVTFQDVAGCEEAVEELHEIKEFLENPKKFQMLGARIPKGALLVGPPGTGKTLLARAVAGEAGVPFFAISGSDFVEMFVGVGAARVRSMFEQAKKVAPCIIFIDEIDAVGHQRGTGIGGGHSEHEQTLNQLLVQMDGFDVSEKPIIILAATNRPDMLDPALLRPGRFDRQIVVDRPDRNGRKKILEVHAKGKPLDADIQLDTLAAGTPGFTGADLANVLNEAALLTARRGKSSIGQRELEDSIMRVIAGAETTRLIPEQERKITAYHEMGHALVGHFLEYTDEVHKISIIGRGRALGVTVSLPSEDRYLMTKTAMREQMAMMLGGRAAEELVFHDVTTGASNDLERVTEAAKQMVMRYGMDDSVGLRVFAENSNQPFLGRHMATSGEAALSDETAREIDQAIRSAIEQAYETAKQTLQKHMEQLHGLSALLIEHETIDKDQFERLLVGEAAETVFAK